MDRPTEMTTLRLREDSLRWLDSDTGIVALELEQSVYLSTNASGALLWSRLSNGTTREELASSLVETFEIPHERAQADVDSFLDALAEQNLLEV